MSDSVELHGPEPPLEGEVWGGRSEVMSDPEEQRVLFAALDSFYQYAKVAHYNTTHVRRQSFYALPKAHWELLAAPPFSYLDTLNAVDDAIDENAELAAAIVKSGLKSFGFPLDNGSATGYPQWKGTATASDLDKARSTLRQFYRDWSSEGTRERAECLEPIINDLQAARKSLGVAKMSVLVPGAGLGRLVFELCRDGFDVEGNEISYHQLLASSYVLNFCLGPEVHKLYPWIHSFSNHTNREHHLKSVRVPDVHPATILNKGRQSGDSDASPDGHSHRQPGEMSMSAADFIYLYGKEYYKDTFDAIATVFFIDTAPNPIRYIETVRNCLRRGGIWANLGPLLWHFENNPPGKHGYSYKCESPQAEDSEAESPETCISDPGSVELTDDELAALLARFGFSFETRESGLSAGYIRDPESMLQSIYRVSHWVARKI